MSNKKITHFIGKYSVPKTLRFALRPMGKTDVNFVRALVLEEDEYRAKAYKRVKELIDDYHQAFISAVLSQLELQRLNEYAELYYKNDKTASEKKLLEKIEADIRKQIAKGFSKDERFSKLFKSDMLEELLPELLTNEEDTKVVKAFDKFTSYFVGFSNNRKNVYTDEPIPTGVPYRIVNDNLPKFLDNIRSYAKIKTVLADKMQVVDNDFDGVIPFRMDALFEVRGFNHVLTQEGIKMYNDLIGGYTTEDGVKVQGINEHVNLYNQKVDKKQRVPKLKQLYKQILSDCEGLSFVPEMFESDQEVLNAVNDFYVGDEQSEQLPDVVVRLIDVFSGLDQFDISRIWIKAGKNITDLSNAVLGDWGAFEKAWNDEYDKKNPPKKNLEKHLEKRKAAYKSVGSFSVNNFLRYQIAEESENNILLYIKDKVIEAGEKIREKYANAEELLTLEYNEKKLASNDKAINLLKEFLDSIKELEKFLKTFLGTGKEEEKDEIFYGEFIPLYERVRNVDKLYDKVRNYVTQKPYSNAKIKLNFGNPQLLGGWDKNKERDYRTVLLRKDGFVYLAIMDKSNNKAFLDYPYEEGEDYYEKMEYKLLPGPNKMLPKVFFAKSNIEYFAPSERVKSIYEGGTFKKGDKFSLSDCHELIEFYKESIEKHEEWRKYGFEFRETADYKDIGEFYKDVKDQGYSVTFNRVSENYINSLVEKGELYLFQIYNKDFSPKSTGKPNLHTMYFKMLFDERNLKDVVYQLNGGAEMFYRRASISNDERVVHHVGQTVDNRNSKGVNKTHTFKYEVIKDKRYTQDQFMLHLPITMNFKADGASKLNLEVKKAIKACNNNYIIGIDRGERNLLYVTVIDETGRIVEQDSLNIMSTSHQGVELKTDYHALLEKREDERDKARKAWKNIESIKELKEGYLSQAVKMICDLIVKYDAIIAMEDLNSGFKNSRAKVEKQVYQKFEKMLTDKLNYLVLKDANLLEPGGTLKAYQLTNKAGGYAGKQDGFIFYVPAWLTSKIDPVTGFAKHVNPKYTSVAEAKKFIENIDDIRFNENRNWFEFDIDYSKFPGGSVSSRKKWTICTNGDRIINFRNKDKNNQWDNKIIKLTDGFKRLFKEYKIDENSELKSAILSQNSKAFFEKLLKLFNATLQMRNSKTGEVNIDYIISPVCDESGEYYNSDDYKNIESTVVPELPKDADANGAYNIARKGLWIVNKIKETPDEELEKTSYYISNKEWLEFVQRNDG